jgi:hypothetical protein
VLRERVIGFSVVCVGFARGWIQDDWSREGDGLAFGAWASAFYWGSSEIARLRYVCLGGCFEHFVGNKLDSWGGVLSTAKFEYTNAFSRSGSYNIPLVNTMEDFALSRF